MNTVNYYRRYFITLQYKITNIRHKVHYALINNKPG